ncbi:MAG: flagellar hook-associated protein FlgK [Eubacteriaceae bacterium]
MSGIFSTFNTATKGMIAQQTALHTTSHNISNANTDGFSRQRVELKADLAYNYAGVGQVGTGVKMESVVRLVDEYVNYQIQKENSTLERYTAKSECMEQLEIIFNEPSDTGLNFNLGEMFDAWQELSKNPENLTSKTMVVEKGKTLLETMNHMSIQVSSLKEDTVNQVEKNIFDFNSILDKIDTLNSQIFNISVKGQVPNDLLDERDLVLKNLSSLSNFSTEFDSYGKVSISLGDEEILGDNAQYEMSMVSSVEDLGGSYQVSISKKGDSLDTPITFTTTDVYTVGQVILNKTDDALGGASFDSNTDIITNIAVNSGQIKGNTEALSEINDRESNLDDLAWVMASAVNTIHKYDGTNDTGIDFFTFQDLDGDGTLDKTAQSIQVNSAIIDDESKVNASYSSVSSEGDGSRALAIASLRNTNLIFNDPSYDPESYYDSTDMTITSQTEGITIEGAYSDIIIKVGVAKEHSDNMVENQGALLDQLELRRESVSGVSIDEEVTNLIKYQKAFEANARVISTLTDMLDTLINRTGV